MCRITGRIRSLLVRPRRALREGKQRGDRRHHRRRHAQHRPAPRRDLRSSRRRPTSFQATYAHYSGQLQRGAVRGTPTSAAESDQLSTTRVRPARDGLRARLGPRELPDDHRGNFPTANVFLEDGLRSPMTKEFTLSSGVSSRGLRPRVVFRGGTPRTSSRTSSTIRPPPERSTVVFDGVNFGTFDNVVYRNTDDVEREYQAMQFIGRYDVTRSLYRSTATRRCSSRTTATSRARRRISRAIRLFGDYPEILTPAQLSRWQAERLPAAQGPPGPIYNQGLGRVGSVDVSGPSGASTRARPTRSSQRNAATAPFSARAPATPTAWRCHRPCSSASAARRTSRATACSISVRYDVPVWKTVRRGSSSRSTTSSTTTS